MVAGVVLAGGEDAMEATGASLAGTASAIEHALQIPLRPLP